MKRIVDGQWLEVESATDLPPGNDGVFETVLWRDDALGFWRPHWARFKAGCAWHGLRPPLTAEEVAVLGCELAAENRITAGVVRFAAWRERTATPGGSKSRAARDVVHWCLDLTPPRPHMSKVDYVVGSGPRLPAAGPDRAFKHLNRTAWTDALRTARAAGIDEALLCDDADRLVEACVSNVFFVREGVLYTPELAIGPLPGIIRAEVIGLARAVDWRVEEGQWTSADLDSASEVWLTNSLIGVRPVAQIAERRLPKEQPVLSRLREAWQERHGWDPVVVM
jgi:branched-subunit amino acid aminotransferase/4-amino-4-deoxychorismate lyase